MKTPNTIEREINLNGMDGFAPKVFAVNDYPSIFEIGLQLLF